MRYMISCLLHILFAGSFLKFLCDIGFTMRQASSHFAKDEQGVEDTFIVSAELIPPIDAR